MADEQKVLDSVPPRWYTQKEIAQVLRNMNYGEPIIDELAPWFFRHLQSAFNKGFQKAQDKQAALSHASATADAKVTAFRNRFISERTTTWLRDGLDYEMARAKAEADANEYEQAFDQAIAAKRGG